MNDTNKVNVINNAGKEVEVVVNTVNGNTQIVINLVGKKKQLSELKPGEVFKANNVEYIVLGQYGDVTEVLRKELLETKMKFNPESNNWKESEIRKYLNREYIKELTEAFGEGNIATYYIDLLSLDGLDDYGTCGDKVSLLTVDQYRKYRKILGKNMDSWWWLITPWSTPSGCSSGNICCVCSDGRVSCYWCGNAGSVRPFFALDSTILVSCESVEK